MRGCSQCLSVSVVKPFQSAMRIRPQLAKLVVIITMLFVNVPKGIAQVPSGPTPVILISIDTLRADHLSSYGYTKIRTPNIDAFAQSGTLFSHAETQIPLTLPSHTVLMTSTYPFQNGVEENGERVPSGTVTLASILQSHGYETAAFIGADFLDARYGLDQGFDDYDAPFDGKTGGAAEPAAGNFRRDGALVLRSAREWLAAHNGQPVFVFVHLFDLHTPYALAPEVATRKGISRYDAQLEYIDELMGRFRHDLAKAGWWDKSLVIVFSDHGEGLGDHRETDHGYYAYESTLHVPLIVHWPKADNSAETRRRNSRSWKPSVGASTLSNSKFPFSSFAFQCSRGFDRCGADNSELPASPRARVVRRAKLIGSAQGGGGGRQTSRHL